MKNVKAIDKLSNNKNIPQLIPVFEKRERKLLSVFMAVMEIVPAFRGEILRLCDYNSGKTCQYDSYMEPQYNHRNLPSHHPDGLIVCKRGATYWSAFIEAKSDNNETRSQQVQKYADLAKKLDIDAVISISKEFALNPKELPYTLAKNKRSGREIFHLSWSEIRTSLGVFIGSTNDCNETEMQVLHHALSFMLHDKSGVKTYDMMPKNWVNFVEYASTPQGIPRTQGLMEIIHGWQQERRDLCAKLNGVVNGGVELRHPAGIRSTPKECTTYDKKLLAKDSILKAGYSLKQSKTHFNVTSDLRACQHNFALSINSPKGKKAKATINWLCEELLNLKTSNYSIRFSWAGRDKDTTFELTKLLDDPEEAFEGRKEAPKSITITSIDKKVRRFKSRKQFIEDLEKNAIQLIKDISETRIFSV